MRTWLVIVATLTLDSLFFVLNLFVFELGGSRSVLSQAVYSITDVVASLMILWGVTISQAPPTTTYPFGRGKERFFWAFTAGLVAFSLAGFLVLVEGLLQMLRPVSVHDLTDDILVIGGTVLVAAASFSIALWEIRRSHLTVREVMASEHQELKIILVQDGVSMAGGAFALSGVYLVYLTGNAYFDGLMATIVGAILIGAGFVFALDARELLVGKGVSVQEGKSLLSIVERYPYVRQVLGLQSMLLGPDEVLVTLRVNFVDELTTDEVEMHIDQLRRFVTDEFPRIRYLIVEPAAPKPRPLPVPVQD